MARFFYPGTQEKKFSKVHGGDIGGGIDAGPDADEPNMLPVPPMFGGGKVPLKKGGIAFSFVGYQPWHIGPGEYVDLPDVLSTKTVKNAAPQLLTKEEAIAAGLANEDGSPIRQEKPAKK